MNINEIEEPEIDWEEIIETLDDYQSHFVTITPEIIAALCLTDCRDKLIEMHTKPANLLLAAKSAHCTLQAALTATLAGTANTGAHPEEVRIKHLEFISSLDRDPNKYPKSDRVMGFTDLLAAAIKSPLPWTNEKLTLSSNEKDLLDRLSNIRHAIEHPKQTSHCMYPMNVMEAIFAC